MVEKHSNNYKITTENGQVELTKDDLIQANLTRLNKDLYHILEDGSSIQGQVRDIDLQSKTVSIEHDNRLYTFDISTALDEQVVNIQKSSAQKNRDLSIKSSMPGLVLDLMVKEEDTVEEGDAVMILEAMKMENVIKTKFSGVIKKIHCEKGQSIEKNQLLIEFYPEA